MPNRPVPASTQALPMPIIDDKSLPFLLAYREWLHNEAVVLGCELFEPFYGKSAHKIVPANTGVDSFHFPGGKTWSQRPSASGRALVVMSAAGVDLNAIRLSPNSFQTWRTILAGGSFVKQEG